MEQNYAIDRFQATNDFTERRDHIIGASTATVLALTCCCAYLYKMYSGKTPEKKSDQLTSKKMQ
jgi:hypothetical protein